MQNNKSIQIIFLIIASIILTYLLTPILFFFLNKVKIAQALEIYNINFTFQAISNGYPKIWLSLGITFGICLIALTALVLILKTKKSQFGEARFANNNEIKQMKLFNDRGIIIGKYKGKFLRFGGQQFVALGAPTRSGKGVGMVVAYLEKGYSLQSAIFCDTGFEFDEMIEYIQKIKDYLKTNFSTNLVILDSSHIIEKWAFEKPIIRGKYEGRKRGFPRTLGVDYCTREAKIKPIREFVLNLSKKRFSTQMLIGYTANEVQKGRVSSLDYARAVYPLNEWGWNEQECGDFLKKRGIANPLYEHFQRTGCYMCPKQNKQSLRSLFFHYPKYWEKAKQLEAKAMELNCLNKTLKIGKSLVEYEQEFKQEGKPLFAEYDEMEYEDVCFCK